MGKQIQVKIPEPCHESWKKMTASEKGRFCVSCQKQVIDFTRMSDPQLAAFFRKPSTASVCGRFRREQLNRDVEMPGKRIPWFKYFFQFAIPALLVSAKVKAQGDVFVSKDTTVSPVSMTKGKVSVSMDNTGKPLDEKTVQGTVVDSQGNPLAGASIIIKGTTIGVTSDNNGNFHLKYNGRKNKIVLQAFYVGFDTVRKTINLKKSSQVKIELVMAEAELGEVVIIR